MLNLENLLIFRIFFSRFTLDSICEIAFGPEMNVDTLHDPNNDFAHAFNESVRASEARFFNPYFKILGQLISTERLLTKTLPIINNFALKIIVEKKKNITDDPMDVLSRFMIIKDDDGKPYSDKFLRDTIMNFIIAGKDTTTQTLTWTTYLLSLHRQKEKKIIR